jgi:hypothetical protein
MSPKLCTRRLLTSLVVAQLAIGGISIAHADPLKCQRAVASAYGNYRKARTKIIQKCQDAAVRSGVPASPTECPTTADDARLQALEQKLRTRIAARCGGADKICDGAGDEPLASIGWGSGVCPDLDAEGCTNAIATCDDVATCVVCIADESITKANGIAYDQLVAGEFATGSDLNDCQRALGKETVRYFQTRAKQLDKCWDQVIKGTAGYTDPPGCPATDANLLLKLDAAEKKKIAKICAACGAGGDADEDGQCDAPGAAFTAAQIGFEPDCPDRVVPSSGRVCDHPGVATLAEVIDCVDCVGEFVSDCGGSAAAPGVTAYLAGCTGAP